jgi:transposase
MAVQIAWGWLTHQRQSALTQWYNRRFAHGGPGARKIGIVAVARRLVIDLWRNLDAGGIPEGAVLKGRYVRWGSLASGLRLALRSA